MKQFPGEWFRYPTLEGDSGGPDKPAPILQVMLTHGRRSRSAFALVDTGAEVSVLPRRLTGRLGITVGPPDTSIATLGGDLPATRLVVGLRISLSGRPIDIPAADFLVPERDRDSSLVILGRHPILMEAELRVQEWRQRFALVTRRRAWMPES